MPRPGRQTTERAKDFKGTLLQLLKTMGAYKISLIVVIVFAILSTIFNIAGPKILAKATTALATGWIARLRGVGSIDFGYIGKILLILLAMYLCSAAFSFVQGWLMTGLSQKVCYDFRRQISQKIDRLPLAYFEKRTVGEVLSRITNDVDTLGQSLNQSVTQLITSVTTMIGVLLMMLSISPRMTLIALLILPVSLALVLLVVSLPFLRARNNLSGRQLLVFSAFPVTQILCAAAIQALIFYPPRYEYTSVLLVVTALFLVSDSLLFRTMVRTEQRVQLEVENELLERQLDAQLAHYRDLTAQYEQIRAMRHDISHHLNTINALLQAGNLQAASAYSEQLLPAQTYSSRLGSCRNPVVDAFLYTRTQEAGLRGVPVRADVSLPVELPVSNTDLIVAFGNLLDNALEACSGIPDAQITLRAHMDKGYLVIQESNPVRPRQPQGKKPRRIPELERGVGFRVLGGLAEKYDGSFRHTCENDTYTVTLLLRAAAAGVPAVPARV